MRALHYRTVGSAPELVDIPTPVPGPGQVLLRVTAAGVCHSDQFIMDLPADQYIYGLPLTLGHEGAGTVESWGAGVTGLQVGDSMLVYGPWGCGRCYTCAQGNENYCEVAAEQGIAPPGLGAPGAMAEFILVDDPRHLVPLGDLDPVASVSLTDAGLTPYHAIKQSLPKLVPGSTAVVIGVGGLGHVGVQILQALSAATIIAIDTSEQKRALALDVGADHVLAPGEEAEAQIRTLTGGKGATAVFDFVGTPVTTGFASRVVGIGGDIAVVGVGVGTVDVGFFSTPWDAQARAPYWGSRAELMEVVELARVGKIHVEYEQFSLSDGPTAYERLRAGTLRGRAVIVPESTTS
ncbi:MULTISPECIES: NAD(P)-dependent alcohol dehydrogenase [unclassified Arthrobacter]|uniref:NAD(P)-dependent alcohol dehydrogenase n=1 Tax=unclassified Arthrobacter TaxID=235627 RepID=UPI0002D92DCC|nr:MULTISPECIES: NAD(P)-dependent alcohol dehydrogenase [unclassified Arthrobacter]PVE19542.1 NAD(P)-dependent alcohol dehydrogenase [Arthrobacter sp. Bz4]